MSTKFNEMKSHLMSGISYVLPVIIGGSLVVAVAKLLGFAGGVSNLDDFAKVPGYFNYLWKFQNVGWTAIGLMNVVLAGYIANSIAGKPALASGFVGGALASQTNAGFIGAVIAGFFAGWLTNKVKEKIVIKGSAASAVPLIILPLLTMGAMGLLMALILGDPLGYINTSLINWVTKMSENSTNAVILALILGAMIGFDLGGPVNKAAWMAGNALFISGVYFPSIIINVAIWIPPLGYGLATLLKKNNYSATLKEAGNGAIVMGVIGITEGAIPFTLVSPAKLIPLNVIASAVGAAITVLLGANVKMPPLGGMYGFFTVSKGWAYLVGGIIGALIIAIGANLMVDFRETEMVGSEEENTETEEIEIEEIEI